MRQRARANKDARPQRATAVVNLGLWQVEWVLAFNIAGAHVIANGVANDPACGAHHQSQLRLRHRPMSIGANLYLAASARRSARRGLEKQFRSFCRIDAIVKISSASAIRLFHARSAAPAR